VKWKTKNCSVVLPSGVKDSLERGRDRCAEEEETQTQRNTHTLPTSTDHPTSAVHKTMSQLCDGIHC